LQNRLNKDCDDTQRRSLVLSEGLLFIIVPILLAIIPLALGYWPVALLLLGIAAFIVFFFRDPDCVPPTEANVIVAPSHGRITRIKALEPGNPHAGNVISIFMSPLDVHVNRAPIAGKITDVTYTKGRLRTAMREDADVTNEQNALTIKGPQVEVVCKQIAGVLARRIVCWKRAGDHVALGERFGMIKFSSRTDLVLPPEVEVVVREGMRVRGGTTIIGRVL
jgi:phosphatidylserine decarboxylase